jgi:hypothetical protein
MCQSNGAGYPPLAFGITALTFGWIGNKESMQSCEVG